jgi:hypothetical protein
MPGELGGWASPERWNFHADPAEVEKPIVTPPDLAEDPEVPALPVHVPGDLDADLNDIEPRVVVHEDPAGLRPLLGPGNVDEDQIFILAESSPEPEEQHSDVVQREASEFVTSTFEAFAGFLIQRIADAHGLTLAYNAVKLVYEAYEWSRVGEDGGGVDFQVPLVGNNPILDVTFHLGGDPDTPPITFGLAPDGESGVGAVAIGKLEMDPAPRHAEVTSSRSQLPEKRFGPVQLVPLRLPPGLRNGLEPADAALAARKAAQDELLPRLRSERQHLRDAGVELVLGCDAELGLALWVHLGDTNRSEQAVTGTDGGRLSIELVPEAVDLVIGSGPEAGLTVSLHRGDSEQSADEVLITWSTPDQLGIELQNEAKIEGQNEAEMVPSEAVRTEGAAAAGPGAGNVAGVATDREGSSVSVGLARPAAAAQPAAAAPMRLTHLERVPVTSIWSAEADRFTPWLLQQRSVLSKVLGIDIELQPCDAEAEPLHSNVVGREAATGSPVIIEKQYGPADDLHLGRILTYAAATRPTTIIWIAEEFREEQRAALDWLNEHTDPAIRFFGVFLYVVTLADAPAGLVAPVLKLAVRPDK